MADKGAVIYGSRRGKVKQLSLIVQSVLEAQGLEFALIDIAEGGIEAVLGCDIVIAASSTWGQGDLQEDWDPVERELREVDLSGRRFACFGSGNSRFPFFCDAPEILEARFSGCGASRLHETLKLDVLDSTHEAQLREWAQKLACKISDAG